MIPTSEIRRKARENGVPETTIERDYSQNWLLSMLPKNIMVLKGGTGIRKVYIENYRFSDDLDFTLTQHIKTEDLEKQLIKAIEDAKTKSGIDFNENIKIEEIENGYEVVVYFRILRRTGSPLRIKIDITKDGNERILLPIGNKDIIHGYSDEFKGTTLVYTFDEIFAEKIRALFERTRPRDLYDVWYLKNLGLRKAFKILDEKCKFKNVQIDVNDLEKRREDFKGAWMVSLRHQLKEPPDFNLVYEETINFLRETLGL